MLTYCIYCILVLSFWGRVPLVFLSFLFFSLIGVQLLCNVVLFITLLTSEPAICIHIYLWNLPPPPQVTTALSRAACAAEEFHSYLFYVPVPSVYISILISQFVPPFPSQPPLCSHVLYICVSLFCPANKLISTILLDSTYAAVTFTIFLFLTYFK